MKRPIQKSNQWEDHYTRRARKENFPARSVYKLEEIQNKFRLIQPTDKVLDLGCAPGSWLMYAARLTRGQVTGIDIKSVTQPLPRHVRVIAGDVTVVDEAFLQTVGADYDVVLSDMAPSTTGNKHADSARSFFLARAALELTEAVLRPGGHFVCKIFQGEDLTDFIQLAKKRFEKVKSFKPQSCRKASKEIYIIAMSKRQEEDNVGT